MTAGVSQLWRSRIPVECRHRIKQLCLRLQWLFIWNEHNLVLKLVQGHIFFWKYCWKTKGINGCICLVPLTRQNKQKLVNDLVIKIFTNHHSPEWRVKKVQGLETSVSLVVLPVDKKNINSLWTMQTFASIWQKVQLKKRNEKSLGVSTVIRLTSKLLGCAKLE